MQIETILTPDAPAPIGPYSQGKRVGTIVYTAGQIALDGNGVLVGTNAAAQTEHAISNLRAVLEAGGASLASVIKTTVFLKSMEDFAAVNEVYGRFFAESAPARSTVEVARLPKDALVEIEAIALVV